MVLDILQGYWIVFYTISTHSCVHSSFGPFVPGVLSSNIKPDLIQKTMLREQRRQLETLQEAVDKIQREQKRSEQSANTPKVLPEIPTADQVAQKTETPPPPTEKQPWPLPSEESNKFASTSKT